MSGLIPRPEDTDPGLSDARLWNIYRKLENMIPGQIDIITDPTNIPYIKFCMKTLKEVEFNGDYSKVKKLNKVI